MCGLDMSLAAPLCCSVARPFLYSPLNLILCWLRDCEAGNGCMFEEFFVLFFHLLSFFPTLKSLLQVDRHTVFSIITNFMRSREEGERWDYLRSLKSERLFSPCPQTRKGGLCSGEYVKDLRLRNDKGLVQTFPSVGRFLILDLSKCTCMHIQTCTYLH